MITGAQAILLEGHMDALRDLGRRGVSVGVAFGNWGPGTRASTFPSSWEPAPPLWSPRYREWFGELLTRNPGAVVFPLGEADSFWLAAWREEHPEHQERIVVPTLEALRNVTLKANLYAAAITHGLGAPKTWAAPTVEAALAGIGDARFPLVVKPQSRCGSSHWVRGQYVRNRAELTDAVDWALKTVHFRKEISSKWPDISIPLVQESVGGRDRPITHICGFVHESGEWAALAHRKLLQAPRRYGNGICFESAPLDEALAERLVTMLRSVGFTGMFEAEFIERGDERMLIDLNPRCFNGMALPTARGLSPIWWSYLVATGEGDRARQEMRDLRTRGAPPYLVYCRKLDFAAMLAGQAVTGGFSPKQLFHWGRWYLQKRSSMIDPFGAGDDPRVGRAVMWQQINAWRLHPRNFLGTYVRRDSGR